MRIVTSEDTLLEALRLCKSEASNAFGDNRILLERYIENPHHIEIQVYIMYYILYICIYKYVCNIYTLI
jgi:acetyl/propionyl-CoA carboxylase alpha subunit